MGGKTDAKPVLYEGGISRTTLSSKHVKRKRKNERGKQFNNFKMTKVFIYKGIVGIQSEETSDALIAKPSGGNLGCVCDASKVQISKEALEALRIIPKGNDGLGEIDVFKSGDKVIFGWLGGYLKAFKPEEIETSRDYNPNLLTHSEGVETPKEFIEFVDNNF